MVHPKSDLLAGWQAGWQAATSRPEVEGSDQSKVTGLTDRQVQLLVQVGMGGRSPMAEVQARSGATLHLEVRCGGERSAVMSGCQEARGAALEMVKELLWPTGEGGNIAVSSELEQLFIEKGETSSVEGYKLIEEDVDIVEEKVKGSSGEFVNSEVEEEDHKSVGGDSKRSIKSKFKHLIKKWRK